MALHAAFFSLVIEYFDACLLVLSSRCFYKELFYKKPMSRKSKHLRDFYY